MRKQVEPGSPGASIIAEELELWARVAAFLAQREGGTTGTQHSHDAELIELRDALAEAKPEDVAPLIEQMMRVSAVAAGRRGKVAGPVDILTPYFGHLRLRTEDKGGGRDVLIGRRGLIDRAHGIQIVDWRDAPVSQIYYRYEEGDDYEEMIPGGRLSGVVEVRRNVTIQQGRLRRIGCPQGNFFCDGGGAWWEALAQAAPVLRGGQGLAARVPRAQLDAGGRGGRGKRRAHLGIGPDRVDRAAFAERVDKHLPEIAALIDQDQFALITQPQSGLVVIQGGAGSGKTTVALHRVAYLCYQDPQRFRSGKVLVIVPSEALVRYVSGVLPSLGVSGVPVLTCQAFMRQQRRRLLPHLPDRYNEDTPAAVSRIKKHPALLRILDDYVRDQEAVSRATLAEAFTDREARSAAVIDREARSAAVIDREARSAAVIDREARSAAVIDREARSAAVIDREARSAAVIDRAGAETQALLGLWDSRSHLPLRPRCRAVRELLDRGSLRRESVLRAEEVLRRLSRRLHDVGRDWAELLTDSERIRRGLAATPTDDRPTDGELREFTEWCRGQQEEVEQLPEDVDPERYQPVDGLALNEGSPAELLDREDDPLLLRLYQLKHGGLDTASGHGHISYEHLVLDEAQDLSPVEVKTLLQCMARGAGQGAQPSVTIAGDVAQRLVFDNHFQGWDELLQAVGITGVQIHHLRLLYRSTAEVMELAQDVLGPLRSSETDQQATRHGAPVQGFRFGDVGEAVAFLGEALRSLLSREPTASVALIARYAGTADAFFQGLRRADVPMLRRVQRHEFVFAPGVDVTDVAQVKGLEFDYVVILDGTAAAYPDAIEPRHLLHIALTRCAHQLWLVSAGEASPLLPAAYFADDLGEPDGAGEKQEDGGESAPSAPEAQTCGDPSGL